MRQLFDNKLYLSTVVIVGGAVTVKGSGLIALFACLTALLALLRLIRVVESQRNWGAIQHALQGVNEFIAGQRWVGNESEILASDRLDDPAGPGPVRFEHICRTRAGSWFLLEVQVKMGCVLHRALRPCDEATARDRLQRHQAAYVRCFGQPAVV
jgi:hypothetical protein